MLLNEIQKRHVRQVATASDAYKNARRDAHIRARQIALEEIAGYQYAMDYQVRLAFEAGVPRRQIGIDGMRTQDAGTVAASLDRTRAQAGQIAAENADPLKERYALTLDGMLKVSLTADELVKAKAAVNFDDAEAEAPSVALFTVATRANGSMFLESAFGNTVPGSFERNPVVFWAFESEHEAEALAWFASATRTEVAA